MMSSSHTRPPWKIGDKKNGMFTIETSGYGPASIAFIVQYYDFEKGETGSEGEANARLISCAPELLNNCISAMQALEVVHDHFDIEGKKEMAHDINAEILELRLIIAKASGNDTWLSPLQKIEKYGK
jgi:hypothetical protein